MPPALPPPDVALPPPDVPAVIAGGPLLGVQKSYAEEGWLDSLTFGGRVYRGLFGVELGASVRLTKVEPTPLEEVLVVVGASAGKMLQPFTATHDRASARLLVDVGPNRRPLGTGSALPDYDADRGVWAAPHGLVGFELAGVRELSLTGASAEGVVEQAESVDRLVPGGVLGLGLVVGRGELWSARLLVLDHLRPNPYDLDEGGDVFTDTGPAVAQHFTLALELGLSSGGL